MNSPRRSYSFFVAAMMLIVGCFGPDASAPVAGNAGNAANARLAPQVTIAAATTETIVDDREFSGRTAAVSAVEIRPRVSGYLLQTPRTLERHAAGLSDSKSSTAEQTQPDDSAYHRALTAKPGPDIESDSPAKTAGEKEALFIVQVQEGDFVTAGAPLFEIDPAPYRLAYLQAAGSLQAANAQLQNYRRELARQQELLPRNATSQSEHDLAVANVAETVGTIANLSATVDRAYLDWTYTQLRSPINGLVGVSDLTLGNLAIADSTVLTTVGAIDPIYVYFEVDENSVLDYLSRIQAGQVRSARDAKIEVEMSLANETTFPHRGVIDFVDNTVTPSTGNYLLRAKFDNSDRGLLPGLFARVRVPFTAPHQAILIPTVALAADQQGQYVMLVDEQNYARRRSVVEGRQRNGRTVILDGLTAGEKVIIDGLQRVHDGVLVQTSSDKVVDRANEPSS